MPTVAAGLAGAGGLAIAGPKQWVTAELGGADRALASSAMVGDGSVPVVAALGLVLLASWGGILVTRGWARRVLVMLGIVAALAAAAAVAFATVAQPGQVQDQLIAAGAAGPVAVARSGWNLLGVLAAVCSLVSLLLAWRRVGDWPEMAGRYDSPVPALANRPEGRPPATADASDQTPADLWKALDRGDDPTVDHTP